MQSGTLVDKISVSRWDATPIKANRKLKRNHFILISAGACLLVGVSYLTFQTNSHHTSETVKISEKHADELRAAASDVGSSSDAKFGEIVAGLTMRVNALEADNKRLSAELTQLLDQDGVIAKLVTHIRALHAQSEATRRDVVDAMTGTVPESNPTFDMGAGEPDSPLETAETPVLSKARHTIVTPVAVSAPAHVATAEKHKAKPAPAEPDEGNTN
ncbi:hypothetical protein [Aureimonas sp. AU12]|uniref:hypothetical protein n=1 Tax=Aureimonas sp. AU12 TaxID=1638161 RepID=UPI0012E34DC6|nr:hypothetical protein [Aureimonas sp. AU12]